jgi:hypothetical protein
VKSKNGYAASVVSGRKKPGYGNEKRASLLMACPFMIAGYRHESFMPEDLCIPEWPVSCAGSFGDRNLPYFSVRLDEVKSRG